MTSQMGSSYVPLDSWVYDAFDRLAAMGYGWSGSAVIRPWTRLECARVLQEAHDALEKEDPIAAPLLDALDEEFAYEEKLREGGRNQDAQVEDVYARFTGISGSPLRDSYHFAQTLVDDDGRPYGQGANGIAGFSSHAEAGPLAFYARGEYQYASAIPACTSGTAVHCGLGWAAVRVGYKVRHNQSSAPGGSLRGVEYLRLAVQLWAAEPVVGTGQEHVVNPVQQYGGDADAAPCPGDTKDRGLGRCIGLVLCARGRNPLRGNRALSFAVFGSASQPLTPPPYIWGVTFSIKPTENFEFGFGHDAIFAGYGRPLNLQTFVHTFWIAGNGQAVDPGKRTTEFNFSYRVPGLRKWLVVYSEAFAYNNPVEGKFVARFAVDPGIYLPQLPGSRRLDLRVEGMNNGSTPD